MFVLLDSSQIVPNLESEHEIYRNLLLEPLKVKLSKLVGELLKNPSEFLSETVGANIVGRAEVAIIFLN